MRQLTSAHDALMQCAGCVFMNGTPDEATLTAWIWRGLLEAGGWRPAWRLQLEVKTLGVFGLLVFGVEVLVGFEFERWLAVTGHVNRFSLLTLSLTFRCQCRLAGRNLLQHAAIYVGRIAHQLRNSIIHAVKAVKA